MAVACSISALCCRVYSDRLPPRSEHDRRTTTSFHPLRESLLLLRLHRRHVRVWCGSAALMWLGTDHHRPSFLPPFATVV